MGSTVKVGSIVEEQEHRHGKVKEVRGSILPSRVPAARYPASAEMRKGVLQGAAEVKASGVQALLFVWENPDEYVDHLGVSHTSVWRWDEGQRCEVICDARAKAERDAAHIAVHLVWHGFTAAGLPACTPAAFRAATQSYIKHGIAAKIASAGVCIVFLELHHDGFDPSDPYAIFCILSFAHLEAWDHGIPSFAVHSSSSPPPTTLPSDFHSGSAALAVDVAEPDANFDRRSPHILAADLDRCMEEAQNLGGQPGASPWTQQRAANAARFLEELRERCHPVNAVYDRTGRTVTVDVTFVRGGSSSIMCAASSSTEDMGVAATSGRWRDSTVGGGFSFTQCSAKMTKTLLGAKQAQADIKNCFFAADRLFLVAKYGSEAEAQKICPGYMAYSEVVVEGARAALLVEAAGSWGLPLPDGDEATRKASLYTVKAKFCSCSNGSGRHEDPSREELRKSTLACKLIDELAMVRVAAHSHELIQPIHDALWRRARVRAEVRCGKDRYAWIPEAQRLDELQERSFLSFCRRHIEATVLSYMITGFGIEGYRTACHVRCTNRTGIGTMPQVPTSDALTDSLRSGCVCSLPFLLQKHDAAFLLIRGKTHYDGFEGARKKTEAYINERLGLGAAFRIPETANFYRGPGASSGDEDSDVESPTGSSDDDSSGGEDEDE